MWPNWQKSADLVTFTEEILNGNFIFFAVFHANATLIYLKYCFINHYNIFAEYWTKKSGSLLMKDMDLQPKEFFKAIF